MSSTAVSHEGPGSLLGFTVTATIVGVLTGLVAASFGLALTALDHLRHHLVVWAHGSPIAGFLLVVTICAAGACAAASTVHRIEPHAEGSGIPRVEAVVEGRTELGRSRILPVKYVGGLLAIGSGLALGREGPSVHMGGNIAITVSRILHRNRYDTRLLVAAGAAAGLATAFNAPIAGGVFVLEELVKRFEPRTTIATLIASAAGFGSATLLLPKGSVFQVPTLNDPELIQSPGILVVGVLAGLVGVAYNKSVMAGLRLADASRMPMEARAALIGAVLGVVGWFAPGMVGSGDALTEKALRGEGTLVAVLVLLVIRYLLGVISYAAATPGGLFAPMLVLGSNLGLLVGLVGASIAPALTPQPAALAVVGFAAFFTATVQAPITGLILVTEMTGSVTMLAPMLGACAIAMVVARVLKSEPIYDALTERSVTATWANAAIAEHPGAATHQHLAAHRGAAGNQEHKNSYPTPESQGQRVDQSSTGRPSHDRGNHQRSGRHHRCM